MSTTDHERVGGLLTSYLQKGQLPDPLMHELSRAIARPLPTVLHPSKYNFLFNANPSRSWYAYTRKLSAGDPVQALGTFMMDTDRLKRLTHDEKGMCAECWKSTMMSMFSVAFHLWQQTVIDMIARVTWGRTHQQIRITDEKIMAKVVHDAISAGEALIGQVRASRLTRHQLTEIVSAMFQVCVDLVNSVNTVIYGNEHEQDRVEL